MNAFIQYAVTEEHIIGVARHKENPGAGDERLLSVSLRVFLLIIITIVKE